MAWFFFVVSLKGRLIRSADSLVDPLYNTTLSSQKLLQRKFDQSLPSVSVMWSAISSHLFCFSHLFFFTFYLLIYFCKYLLHSSQTLEECQEAVQWERKRRKSFQLLIFVTIHILFFFSAKPLKTFWNLNISPNQRTCLCSTLYANSCCVLVNSRLTLIKEICM